MRRGAIVGLKILACFPLAIIIGAIGARVLEDGLIPLLFLSAYWLHIVDIAMQSVFQVALLGGLIWFWALDR